MAIELTPEERETNFCMTGDDHAAFDVFSDDPYWIRRFEKIGVAPYAVVGAGFKYKLRADQVLVRKGKRVVSEEQRAALRQRAHFGGKIPSGTREIATLAEQVG